METKETLFGLKLGNLPLINIRGEFKQFLESLRDKDIQSSFMKFGEPIRVGDFDWYGSKSFLLTIILQRVILGLESYIAGIVHLNCGHKGLLTDEIIEKIRNPMSCGGRGTAENYYCKLPDLTGSKIRLEKYDLNLYQKIKKFYKLIRNPIFHGFEIQENNPIPVLESLELIKLVYKWIDSWYSLDKIMRGANKIYKIE